MKFKIIILAALLVNGAVTYSQKDTTLERYMKNQNGKEQKKYILAMIKSPAKSYSGKVDSLFQLHKKFINNLEKTGQLNQNGSGLFAGIEKYSGIYVFNTDTKQKAEEIISSDPGYKKLYDLELYIWYPSKESQ